MVNILDLGYGNTISIGNTIESLEYQFKYVKKPNDLESGVIILPGVGSIKAFNEGLEKYGWAESLTHYAEAGHNIIGICLGLHALTAYSEESGGMKCLNLFNQSINTIQIYPDIQNSNTGWDEITISRNFLDQVQWEPYFNRSKKKSVSGRVFYNHVYGCKYIGKNSIQINKNKDFASIIAKKNILGIQFHPEKSQQTGKEILKLIL